MKGLAGTEISKHELSPYVFTDQGVRQRNLTIKLKTRVANKDKETLDH